MKIFLVGFMGSGKSSLGKKLAAKMDWPFFDLDEEIENKLDQSVPDIFEKHGEAFFRQKEMEMLSQTIKSAGDFVMACGGGTPCFHGNMAQMNSVGSTVFLYVDQEILFGRLRKKKAERPLISGLEDAQLRDFIAGKLAERESYYLQAKHVLRANNPTVKQVMELLGYLA